MSQFSQLGCEQLPMTAAKRGHASHAHPLPGLMLVLLGLLDPVLVGLVGLVVSRVVLGLACAQRGEH